MKPSELDKAVEYTKQFIEAATPIAKRAYEIGLLTLRIDAVQSLILALVTLIGGILLGRKLLRDWREAKRIAASPGERGSRILADHPISHLPMDGIAHLFGSIGVCVVSGIAILSLADVWLWVKLFVPDLWLAHRAIEKLIS